MARLKAENAGLRELLGIAGIPAPGFEDEVEPVPSLAADGDSGRGRGLAL